jgi:hypothetical protein
MMRRLGLPLAFLTLASASATAQPQEADTTVADTTEALCTAWTLDITNHTRLEVQIYEYLGEVSPIRIDRTLKGLLILIVPARVRNKALLFEVRPTVLVYAFQDATDAQFRPVVDENGRPGYEQVSPDRPARTWLLGVASPDEQRGPWGRALPSLAPGLVLKFICLLEDEADSKEPPDTLLAPPRS